MRWGQAPVVLALLLVAAATAGASESKVVIAQSSDPSTLDMMNHQDTPASNVGAQIFDTLVERDHTLKLVPGLAAEMPKPISPTTWEITLRKGVKFHNGEDFTADSVKYSLERVANPAHQLLGSTPFGRIDRVEIVSPSTVRVHTKTPWPIFSAALSLRQAAMYPPRAYAGKTTADIARTPIGTGPYKFVRWSAEEGIVLEGVPGWRGAPRIKTVVFRPILDDVQRLAALQTGEIDVAVSIPPDLANVVANHPKLSLSSAPSIRTIQLMIDSHQMDAQHQPVGPYPGPTADKRVRQAIAYAIDADEIIKTVLDGRANRVATMLTSLHFGFDPSLKPIKPDLDMAKKLLTDAGYPNGVDIVLNGPRDRYVRDHAVGAAVAAQLTRAGIRTTLRTFEYVSYLNTMVYVHKAGPVWLIGWGTPTVDAETVYGPLFRSGSLFVNWHHAEFNRLADEARTIIDDKKRLEQYHRISRLWLEEVPAVPLYQQIELYGASKRLIWKARGDEVIKAFDMALK